MKIGFPFGIFVGSIISVSSIALAFWLVSSVPLLGSNALAALLSPVLLSPVGSIIYLRARKERKINFPYLLGSTLPAFVYAVLLIVAVYIVLASSG